MQQIIGVFDNLKDWLSELFSLIPKFMYFLCATLMSLIDALQYVLRKLAGLDVYYVDGKAQTGDIALNFIKSIFDAETKYPAIKNTFWSLVIFGFILLVIATIVAIIRQEYMPSSEDLKEKPSNNKLAIVKRGVKSLFLFLIVPVSCVFGLMISDLILYGLDTITASTAGGQLDSASNVIAIETASNGQQTYAHFDFFWAHRPTTTTTFSGSMFKAAAYDANRIRQDESYEYEGSVRTFYEYIVQGDISNFGIFNAGSTQAECAQLLDDAFTNCVRLKSEQPIDTHGPMKGLFGGNFSFSLPNGQKIEYFSKFNVGLVYYYYDLWYFNFLIGFAFLIICIKLFYNIIMGLMKRIIEMVGLFIISPPIIAIMPLDGGKAFTNWKSSFISKALAAYGAIIGMNVFFLILPYLNEIELFEPNLNLLNIIFSCLFILVGLVTVEGFIGLLSGFIGADDPAKAGAEISGKVGDTLAKSAKMTGAAAGFGTKMATLPFRGVKQFGHAIDTHKRRKKLRNEYEKQGMSKKAAKQRAKQEETILKSKQRFNRGVANLFSKKKTRQRIKQDFQNEWNNGGAEQAYDQYLMNDKTFQSELNQLYGARKAKFQDLTMDEWLKTGEGITAKNLVKSDVGNKKTNLGHLEDFSTFMSNAGTLDADGNITGAVAGSAGAAAFESGLEEHFQEGMKEHRAKRFKGFAGGVGSFASFTGVKNMASIGSLFLDETKSGMVQGGKGGFVSMIKAFKGLSAKQIEQEELLKKLQKEEKIKVQIQENERKKAKK